MENGKRINKVKVIIAIAIFLIIVCIITTIIIINKKNSSSSNSNATGENQSNTYSLESDAEVTIEDEDVQAIIEKFNFKTSTIASIYKNGDFDMETIPNDLILRIAWDRIDDGERALYESDENENVSEQIVTGEAVQKSVENIFGYDLEYVNESFYNVDVETFEDYNTNKYTVEYEENDNTYNTIYEESSGVAMPYISQYFVKAIKNDSKVEIYVKTAFVDTEYNYLTGETTYILYSDYNFDEETFENEIVTYTDNTYDDSMILTAQESLNTYVYTYILDDVTDEYYLQSFNLES